LKRRDSAERLQELEREDKWFLSGGDGFIWAPPFPTALNRPGFWDEALVYYHAFAPLFSVALVRPDGNEIRLELSSSRWRPDKLTVEWKVREQVVMVEERFVNPGGQFVSLWSRIGEGLWDCDPFERAQLVGYTAQPGETVKDIKRSEDGTGISWRRLLFDRHGEELSVHAQLSPAGNIQSKSIRCAAIRSEGVAPIPVWEHTPFWEAWRQQQPGSLPDWCTLEGVSDAGLVHAAVAIPLTSTVAERIGFSIRLTPEQVRTNSASPAGRPVSQDPAYHWAAHFDSYPEFSCSDDYLTRYYYYRLYGLRLNSLAGNSGNVHYPAIAEGIGYFHVPITYSAQCHMWETRWSHDPSLAHGSLLNFLDHQRDDGSLHGRIYTNHLKHTDFYHANWGDAVLAVDSVHKDGAFLERSYSGLSRYMRWLDRTRDTEQSGMYDVANHFETGQEYMSRYQAVDQNADRAGWQGDLRLKGIDITVYAHQLKRCLETLARRLRHDNEAGEWSSGADRIASAIIGSMWNEETGLFSDVDPGSGSRTNVKAAVCFYPLLTDFLTHDMVGSLLEHLNDPAEFGTQFPVPSSAVGDPNFNANAQWKGKRHNCPWNGRTWPMTNSHIVEGLLRQWHSGRRVVGPLCADFLMRFIRMMYYDRDINRPNCFEHYNPQTGHPSAYRGIDDYQHSWVLDLIIRGVAGLEPRSDHILIDPLPLDVNEVQLLGATIRGNRVDIVRHGQEIEVTVNCSTHTTTVGNPLTIPHE
jgi:hypothetical protein